jgi:hypothetical protein
VAIVASLLLALSPILMKTSRLVAGPATAALFLSFVFLLLIRRSIGKGSTKDAYLVGVALGLGLAAGPEAYQGIFSLVLAYLFIRFLQSRDPDFGLASIDLRLQSVLPGLVLTVLLLGTGFGFAPSNLRGIFEGLGSWLQGWRGGGINPFTILFLLLAYEPVILIFGTLRVTSLWKKGKQIEIWILAWFLGSLLASLVYPHRQAGSLIWVVVPMILLAGYSVQGVLDDIAKSRESWLVLAFGLGFFVLFAFAYLQLSSFTSLMVGVTSGSNLITHLGASISALALVVAAGVLISFGWSRDIAWSSLRTAGFITLLGLSISASWNLNFGKSSAGARELWNPHGTTKVVGILEETLKRLSEAETGRDDSMLVEVYGDITPTIAWVLRDFPKAGAVPPDVFLIPETQARPVLPVEYRGQVLTLGESWGWSEALPPDLIRWWVRREVPVRSENWILFARQDLGGLQEITPILDE